MPYIIQNASYPPFKVFLLISEYAYELTGKKKLIQTDSHVIWGTHWWTSSRVLVTQGCLDHSGCSQSTNPLLLPQRLLA